MSRNGQPWSTRPIVKYGLPPALAQDKEKEAQRKEEARRKAQQEAADAIKAFQKKGKRP